MRLNYVLILVLSCAKDVDKQLFSQRKALLSELMRGEESYLASLELLLKVTI